MSRRIDATDERFGRLIAVSRVTLRGRSHWHCLCDCGQRVTVALSQLRCGHTQSCGCLQRERASETSRTHGEGYREKKTKEYRCWQHAKGRCHTPSDTAFKNYGGRGIYMCERWRASYLAFLADMGRCPPNRSLDRINNDGPYAPDNCRWATQRVQSLNSRRIRWLTHQGETLSLSDWARRLKVSPVVLCDRLDKLQWPLEKALTTPLLTNQYGHPR